MVNADAYLILAHRARTRQLKQTYILNKGAEMRASVRY